eukprot:scaffold22591_cov125-Cylindrotheca_fusiformis.AAC.2
MIMTNLYFFCFLGAVQEVCGFSKPRNFHLLGRSSEVNTIGADCKCRLTERVMFDEVQDLLIKRRVVEKNEATSHLKMTLPGVMETLSFPENGSIVFKKGERSDGLYFVEAGVFECVNGDGNVVATLNEGELFGELGILLAEPRALTVRSACPNAKVWFVNAKAYNLLSQIVDDSPAVQTSLEVEYKDYMDFRAKRKSIQSFKPFRKQLSKYEIEQVAQTLRREFFEAGQDVVVQGSDDSVMNMYFLDSGSFEVYDADTGNVLMTYNTTNGYFGELAFFLNQPRAKSIRASSRGSLFLLSRKDLFKIVDEGIFEDEFLSLLADQYRDKGLFEKYEQVLEYLEFKSRPKKKPVSLHSTVAIVAAGSYLTAYQSFFRPGLDKDGFLRFFDFYQLLSIDACHQIQLSVALLALAGIMGYFRIPPNAPAARRLPFVLAALTNVFFALVITSSLNGLPAEYWFFDAFSNAGKAAIGLVFFIEEYFLILSFDNAISGPTAGMAATPGATDRATNIIFAALIYFFVNAAEIPLVAPMFFSDISSYQSSMSAALETAGLPALNFHTFATAVGFGSFLQLVATFQFEKKISETVGLIAFVTLFVVFNCDAILSTYKIIARPELLPIIENTHNYLPNLLSENHLFETILGVTGLVVANAIRKAVTMDKKSGPLLRTTKF